MHCDVSWTLEVPNLKIKEEDWPCVTVDTWFGLRRRREEREKDADFGYMEHFFQFLPIFRLFGIWLLGIFAYMDHFSRDKRVPSKWNRLYQKTAFAQVQWSISILLERCLVLIEFINLLKILIELITLLKIMTSFWNPLQSPNSYFMDVKCATCRNIAVIFRTVQLNWAFFLFLIR